MAKEKLIFGKTMMPKRGPAGRADGTRSRGMTLLTGGSPQLHLTQGGMDTTLIAIGRASELNVHATLCFLTSYS